MMDIRLKTAPFDFDGRHYELCCNMNVLADVQEQYGGEILEALNAAGTVRTMLDFLTAMLNDYGEDQGWPRLTARQVGKRLAPGQIQEIQTLIYDLVTSSVQAEAPPETDPKN